MSAYLSIAVPPKRIIICAGTLNLGVAPWDDFVEKDIDETFVYTQNCVLAGDVVAKDLNLHTGSFQTIGIPIIKVTGAPGGDAKSADETHRIGGNGGKGYSFYFSAADFDYRSRFRVDATGGDGGCGYFDATTQWGGSGGDGGPGGKINIMYEDSYQRAMGSYSAYEYALSKEDPNHPEYTERMVKQAAKETVNVIHVLVETDKEYNKEVITAMADLYEQLNKTDKHNRPDITITLQDLKEKMATLRKTLEYRKPGEGMLVELRDIAAIHGGFPGRGYNSTDRPDSGGRGIYGRKGEHWGYGFMDYDMIWDRDIFLYHPDQMALTLRDAYAQYFKGAGGRDAKGIKDCAVILGQLINRLGFLSEIDPKNPTNKSNSSLWKTLKRYESDMLVLPSITTRDGLPASIQSLQRTYTQAVAYMIQLGSGQDIYGHSSTWVPVGSYEHYQAHTKEFLEHFKDIEKNYQAYMKKYRNQVITKAEIDIAIADASRAKEKIKRHQTKMKGLIQDLILSINRLNEQVAPKRKLVLDSIKEVESKIKNSYVVPIKELLESAVSFCFMPSKLMGAAVGAQAVWSIVEGASNIEDDAGNVVKKEFLITRLQEMDGSVESLKDGIALTNAGSLKPGDAGGPKLVAEKEKLFTLIKQYRSLITNWSTIEAQFDDYINTVTTRNDRALQYNQYLISWWQDQLELQQVQDDAERLRKKGLDQVSPNVAAVTSFVQQAYHATVDRIFKVLYMTERAQLFWTLGEPLGKFDTIRNGGVDGGSLYKDLQSLSDTILEAYEVALENSTSASQKFGDWGEKDGPNTGLTYTLSATELKHLQAGEEQTSVNMANTWAQKSKDKNIFLGKYDVRLTKIKPSPSSSITREWRPSWTRANTRTISITTRAGSCSSISTHLTRKIQRSSPTARCTTARMLKHGNMLALARLRRGILSWVRH
ncbi:predicted protein [Uncinocarpus reesii 1704]|uniref:Uncharacterized protein n=1 Tax=Uncinocarpus reesii (strain UAMH 1704) TaxID=336963 RepID=C4JN72_UNCRE|nr:uncharacterized protein UREG_04280 [Uncinocarpus reesii 1704]EEP79434.1 predicted protein [Uncinocarpus reesii 1704]